MGIDVRCHGINDETSWENYSFALLLLKILIDLNFSLERLEYRKNFTLLAIFIKIIKYVEKSHQ
jgi:hypothetical protein